MTSFCSKGELRNPKTKHWILSRLQQINLTSDLILINRHKTPIIQQNGINLINFDSFKLKTIKFTSKNHLKLQFIIKSIIDQLQSDSIKTLRDLYYSNVSLFESQKAVVDLVEDLACSLGISRKQLNLVASQKGMVSGPIKFISKSGNVDCSTMPITIPNLHSIDYMQTTATRLLIVEKDATFQALLNGNFHATYPSTVLLTVIILKGKRLS